MLRSINKQLIQTTLLVPLAFGIQYLVEIEIARRIGPSEFGSYSLMAALVVTSVMAVLLGIPLSFPSLQGRERRRVGHGVAIVSILALLGTVTMFLAWYLLYGDILAAIILATGFLGSSFWLVRRYLGVTAELLLPGVFGPKELIVFPLTLIAIIFWDISSGENAYMMYAVFLLFGEIFILGFVKKRSFPDTHCRLGSNSENKAIVARGLGFLKNSLGNLAFVRADVLLVALVLNVEQLGNYALASRLALIGSLPIRILEVRYSPSMARKFAESGYHGARAELRSALPISCVLSFSLLIPAFAAPIFLLGSIFEDFETIRDPVMVLVAAHLIASALTPFGTFLSMTGHHHRRGNVTLIFAALLIPLLIAGAVYGGVLGASVAMAATIVAMRLTTVYFAARLR